MFGKSIVDGDAGSNGDLALVGTFFVVVLVGTFASQVRQGGGRGVLIASVRCPLDH